MTRTMHMGMDTFMFEFCHDYFFLKAFMTWTMDMGMDTATEIDTALTLTLTET
jgi:hypothetical protein